MRSRLSVATPRLYVPLSRLALCADCEVCFEIGVDACPACGGETWSSLPRLLGNSAEAAVVRAVRAVVAETRCSGEACGDANHLVIVSREQPRLFELLERELRTNPSVTVILDRRGRRPQTGFTGALRNQRQRNVDRQIAALGWAIVRSDVAAAKR
jgi:hypothetical protein